MTVMPYDTISTTSQMGSIFTKCCCCIPIRIGCFILGYLNLILNAIHTLFLFTLFAFIGISTHGFDHFDSEKLRNTENQETEIEVVERPLLTHFEIILVLVLCANVSWLIMNLICLIGLHKKRPRAIKVYIAFATARLILVFFGLIYLTFPGQFHNNNTQAIVTYCVDLGLGAYFIFVYYIYAIQLEREQIRKEERQKASDIAFVYPTKVEKEILVA